MRSKTFMLGAWLFVLATPAFAENLECGSFPLLDDAIPQEQRAERLLKRATTCVQEGRPLEAINLFSELIGLQPDNETAYLNRGNAYIQVGQFALGIADYSQVIAMKPDMPQAWYNRGTAFVAAGEYERAIADLSQAIRLDPGQARAYCNRGMSYLRKSDYDKALEDLDLGIQKDGKLAHCYYARGELLAGKGDYRKAIEDLTAGIGLKPTVEGFIRRAAAYERVRETDNALADYQAALKLDPRSKAAQAGAQRITEREVP